MTPAHPIQQLRIGRITVEAAPGTDRHALQRALQQQLPAAIAARLQAGSLPLDAQAAASPIADAVARHVAQRVAGEVPR